jgi:hypothetical protein
MAGTPRFGGTNGVTEMDIGQPGIAGGLYANNQAHFTVKVFYGAPQVREALHTLPQQDQAYMDRLGWSGEIVRWQGIIRFDTVARIHTVKSRLQQYRTGQSINSTTGVRSARDTSFLSPTILEDVYSNAHASAAVLRDFVWGGNFRASQGSATFNYINQLTVLFQVLG